MNTPTPVDYADQLGRDYTAQLTDDQRAELGHYLTPPLIARFMGRRLAATVVGDTVKVLDPAAGAGILSCAACEALAELANPPARIELTCYEVDTGLSYTLDSVLQNLRDYLATKGVELHYTLNFEDYVLATASALSGQLFGSKTYNAIISNPPYFKLNKADPRAVACSAVVHGQPNIYGFFMALAASTLRDGAHLSFIVPRSFAAGPYFRAFREHFFARVRPVSAHLFASRRDAFSRDEVLQENVIIDCIRQAHWPAGCRLRITSSAGMRDIDEPEVFDLPLAELLDLRSKDKVLVLPGNADEVAVFDRLSHWTGSLHQYGWNISTGPVVPFRATDVIVDEASADTVPLLWMQNVKAQESSWPVQTRKAQHILANEASVPLLLPNKNYVLLRRFSSKEQERRLTAAPYLARNIAHTQVGLENHLNYVHAPRGELSEEEVIGLSALFNSRLLDNWFRAINGNTQVSATEIRAMPLPPLAAIRALGAAVGYATDLSNIDELVERFTGAEERHERCATG